MKNSNLVKKSFLGAMALGMTITGAAGVYAGTKLEKITAYLNGGIGIQVDGKNYAPVDAQGNKLTPITYRDTTYLPVRALADALHVPLVFDAKTNQVIIGTPSSPTSGLTGVNYSDTQVKEIKTAFAKFDGFETPYAPTLMAAGDTYQQAAAGSDGVNLVFAHMIVNVSPRDDSYMYEGTEVKLSNGTTAKWYKPDDTELLSFKLDDRIVTISSPDSAIAKAQLEKIAVGVAKL